MYADAWHRRARVVGLKVFAPVFSADPCGAAAAPAVGGGRLRAVASGPLAVVGTVLKPRGFGGLLVHAIRTHCLSVHGSCFQAHTLLPETQCRSLFSQHISVRFCTALCLLFMDL